MYTFSLIMATYGRKDEIREFILSLLKSNYDLSKVELIIVDQNDSIVLDDIVDEFKNELDIQHIKSDVKGLSLNRNIGIKKAKGDIIAFPDDDCKYFVNTLETVNGLFQSTNADILMGKILDESNKDCIRKWPEKSIEIKRSNFYTKISSITIFKKITSKTKLFDENMGVGTYYGSNEDADTIYNELKEGKKVIYHPSIKLFHPSSVGKLPLAKIESYGLGFGALCKKNKDVYMLKLFYSIILYHSLKYSLAVLKNNKEEQEIRKAYIKSRLNGFKSYN